MYYIYKYINKINKKVYVGKTNNPRLRQNGHRSIAYNPKEHSYHHPFYQDFRKYGEEGFSFEVIEQVDDDNKASEREEYWTNKLGSNITGYNIKCGNKPPKKSYEEKTRLSQIFSSKEIKDIQRMLIAQKTRQEIYTKYPKLSGSYLSNINLGFNYYNPDFNYPLKKKRADGAFSHNIKDIKRDIKKGIPYSQIAEKYNIKSMGFISSVNSGRYYYDKNEIYPLCIKGTRRRLNERKANEMRKKRSQGARVVDLMKEYKVSKRTVLAVLNYKRYK